MSSILRKTNLKMLIFVLAYWGRAFPFIFWENWKQKALSKLTDLQHGHFTSFWGDGTKAQICFKIYTPLISNRCILCWCIVHQKGIGPTQFTALNNNGWTSCTEKHQIYLIKGQLMSRVIISLKTCNITYTEPLFYTTFNAC